MEKEEMLEAIIDVSVVPAGHEVLLESLKGNPNVRDAVITFGKPDMSVRIRVRDFRSLYRVVTEITGHPKIASSNTRLIAKSIS